MQNPPAGLGPVSAFEQLLPKAVASYAVTSIAPNGALLGSEAAVVRKSVSGRRDEFAAGRACARTALSSMGFGSVEIGQGDSREPLWPTGVVGSITHCAGFCGAAVAFQADICALGIDAAVHEPLGDELREVIVASAGEAVWFDRGGDVRWDVVLFSAKEAAFKAWWPMHRGNIGFGDIEIEIIENQQCFVATVTEHDSNTTRWPGRFTVSSGLVLTTVAMSSYEIRGSRPNRKTRGTSARDR